MKKFLDQDFSGAALAEFKREVSNELAFYMHVRLLLMIFRKKEKKVILLFLIQVKEKLN